VGWNIVTSYLRNAGTNLGFDQLPPHDARYNQADEYLEVVYKLWEGSWEDDAVLRDRVRGRYCDPAKIHAIHHQGTYYKVEGPHLAEPSPQRTPVLFQAGTSTRGRAFAARHAECVFFVESLKGIRGPASAVRDIRKQAAALGRDPDGIRFFQGLSPVVGGTEAEAKARANEYVEQMSMDGALAHISGTIGVDLGEIDIDLPLQSLQTDGMRGWTKGIVEAEPDQTKTFRDLIRARTIERLIVGTPEQIADGLQAWFEAGVDGFNITYNVTPGTFVSFIDAVVPELQARGLVQREYAPGTLREKLFGHPRLPSSHPAAAYRY
jgi:FMN-dependent oxidoreductase (nitrilotriacetate monooxygenase family)